MLMVLSEFFFFKDCKCLVYWSDLDIDIFVDVLLCEWDIGCMVDNGFKFEVWKEVVWLFENLNFVGGLKILEVCRSRWQRVSLSFIMLVL